jgi:recombination protein RecT
MQTSIQTTQNQSAVPKSVKSWLTSDYFKTQVALVLPKHITPERFCRVAISAVTRIPKLAQCSPESVLKCMMTCSELGIEPDGRRAHLIPFGKECTLIVDYKGLVELAKRSGDVSSIFANTVCQQDDFTYDTGEIHHRIDFKRPRGEMYAVYAIVTFKDGGKHTEVMTKDEVDRIRRRSRASANGPWVTDYDEMAKKTVFRRASKWIVLSPEVQDALDKESDTHAPTHAMVTEAAGNLIALPEGGDDAPQESEPVEVKAQVAAEPQVEASSQKIHTVQETLAEIVTGGGFTFDDFARWARESGNIPTADELPGFEAVSVEVARRLTRAKVGLLNGLAEMKGAAK